MKYVLDTNAVSALMRGEPAAVQALRGLARTDVSVPQPVFAEIAYGIGRLPASRRRRWLESRFELVRAELSRATWTDGVTDSFGEAKASLEKEGQRLEDLDLAIAAHALAAGATLVTADAEHMARVHGLSIEDWLARRDG